MSAMPVILLLSGSLRTGSTNEVVLRTAEDVAPSARVRTVLYDGLAEPPLGSVLRLLAASGERASAVPEQA